MGFSGTLTFSSLIFGVGMLHAFDADHLLAVSSLTEKLSKPRKVLAICSYWALGHGLTLLTVGAGILLLGMAVPDRLSRFAEYLVGFMLVGIGLQALWRLVSRARGEGVAGCFIQKIRRTSSDEMKNFSSSGENKGPQSAFFVGMIHGLAGSAPLLALIPISHQKFPWLGFAYLILFCLGVLISMLAFGGFLGILFGWLKKRVFPLLTALHATIAVGTICLGGYWIIGNSWFG